ncbi:cupin domain-containing protein [Burkholderia pyrrocinia]|uniref:cupin domain-containing protein n=1 Tax=Burkholderia pyrrocinia TaxID=60550 RepID=UPI001FC80DC5|nr:cupin domain-containing protein [Burkholderia pyrrocinia]
MLRSFIIDVNAINANETRCMLLACRYEFTVCLPVMAEAASGYEAVKNCKLQQPHRMVTIKNRIFRRGSMAAIVQAAVISTFIALSLIYVGDVMAEESTHKIEKSKEFWIKKLGLAPHPEGGYFRYEFGSDVVRKTASGAERKDYSGIYFMVTHDSPSHFHQMKSDEIWYYHAGDALTMHVIDEAGKYRTVRIGPNPDRGEVLSVVMHGGWIFGASVDSGDYTLVSCTVVPGFDEADYRILMQSELLEKYPENRNVILKMAYKNFPK